MMFENALEELTAKGKLVKIKHAEQCAPSRPGLYSIYVDRADVPGLPRLNLNDDGGEGFGDFPTGTFTSPFKQIGRNDPCPCGSGKKYKKCCLH